MNLRKIYQASALSLPLLIGCNDQKSLQAEYNSEPKETAPTFYEGEVIGEARSSSGNPFFYSFTIQENNGDTKTFCAYWHSANDSVSSETAVSLDSLVYTGDRVRVTPENTHPNSKGFYYVTPKDVKLLEKQKESK